MGNVVSAKRKAKARGAGSLHAVPREGESLIMDVANATYARVRREDFFAMGIQLRKKKLGDLVPAHVGDLWMEVPLTEAQETELVATGYKMEIL